MDVIKLLNELEGLVEDTHVFFNISWDFHKEDFLDITNKIRASLPDEVKRATRLTAESEKVIVGARMTAEQTLEDAQETSNQITKESRASAERHLRDAEAQAQKMTAAAEAGAKSVVGEAHAKAEAMLREAHQESEKLISQSELVRLATVQAREIIAAAEYEARDLRKGADEYAHGVVSDLERTIGELSSTIERGRKKLDQRLRSSDNAAAFADGRNGADFVGGRH